MSKFSLQACVDGPIPARLARPVRRGQRIESLYMCTVFGVACAVTGGATGAQSPPESDLTSPSVVGCTSSGFFTAYAREGLVRASSESLLVLDVPVDVHSADCGAPDCYGHSMTLTLELRHIGERCEIVSAKASASPFNNCEGHFPEPVSHPWTNDFAVKDAPDLLDDGLERVELRDARRREALLLLPDGYYFYEDVEASSQLRPKLDPVEAEVDSAAIDNCCYGYSSSASQRWPRGRK